MILLLKLPCYEESTLQRANAAVWEHRKRIEESDIDTKRIGRQRMASVANLRGILGIRGKTTILEPRNLFLFVHHFQRFMGLSD